MKVEIFGRWIPGFRFQARASIVVALILSGASSRAALSPTDTPTESATETPTATESDTLTESASPTASETSSPSATATPTPGPLPAAPGVLTAVCGDRTVYLTWDGSGFSGFDVYRGLVKLNSAPLTIGAFQDQGLTDLVAYDYSVVGLDGFGNPSQPATIQGEPAAPPVPGGNPPIEVTQSLGRNLLTIQGGEPSGGGYPAATYEVLRSSDGGNSFASLGFLPPGPGPFTFEDTTIESGVEYWYSVRVGDGRVPCESSSLYPTVKAPPLDYRLTIERNRVNPRAGESARVRLSLLDPASVRLVVFTPSGLRVRVLIQGDFPAGERSLIWDGRNDGGAIVAPGVYILHAEVHSPAGRRSLTGQVGVMY